MDNVNTKIETNPMDEMDKKYGPRDNNYNLRARRPRDYDHLHVITEITVMIQHSINKGLKVFGEECTTAVLKELTQLHEQSKKSTGQIKGRRCADVCKHHDYISKEDASSPTVTIESVMLCCVIDAKEGRDVATVVDIPEVHSCR
eukprot:scaffold25220_cov34-Attheya_sp.AAC.1